MTRKEGVRDNKFYFTVGAKIDGPYAVRSGGDAYVAPLFDHMVRQWKSQ
jgi:hypothetical protein